MKKYQRLVSVLMITLSGIILSGEPTKNINKNDKNPREVQGMPSTKLAGILQDTSGNWIYAESRQIMGAFAAGFVASVSVKTIDLTGTNPDRNIPGIIGLLGAGGLGAYCVGKGREQALTKAESDWDTLRAGSVAAIAASLGYGAGTISALGLQMLFTKIAAHTKTS